MPRRCHVTSSKRLPWTCLLQGVHLLPCLSVQVMSPSTSSWVGRVLRPSLLPTPSLMLAPVIFVHLLRDFIPINNNFGYFIFLLLMICIL